MTLEDWNPTDLRELLTLAPSGPSTWRSRFGDANLNGRSYGGQLLGQATSASSLVLTLPTTYDPSEAFQSVKSAASRTTHITIFTSMVS